MADIEESLSLSLSLPLLELAKKFLVLWNPPALLTAEREREREREHLQVRE